MIPLETLQAVFTSSDAMVSVPTQLLEAHCLATIGCLSQTADASQLNHFFLLDNAVSLVAYRSLIQDGKMLLVVATRYMDAGRHRVGMCPYATGTWKDAFTEYDMALRRLSDFFTQLRNSGIEFGEMVPTIHALPDTFLQDLEARISRCRGMLPTVSLSEYLRQQQQPAANQDPDMTPPTSHAAAYKSSASEALRAIGISTEKTSGGGPCAEGRERGNSTTTLPGFSPLVPYQSGGTPSSEGHSPFNGADSDDDATGAPNAATGSNQSLSTFATTVQQETSPELTPQPPASTGDLMRVWSRFSIERTQVLGKGAFGTVYKAWDADEGRYVAVKEVRLEHSAANDAPSGTDGVPDERESARRRALREEFKTLASLDHDNIVRVIDLALDDVNNYGYIFMEWMPSGSLQAVVRSQRQQATRNGGNNGGGGLKPRLVARYTSEMLRGLAYLHQKQMLHCDIKPGNVLLSASGAAKLSDFGTIKQLAAVSGSFKTVSVVGTVPYLAPECLSGKYSKGSDIWALGCTVLELLTGDSPWSEAKLTDQIQLIFKIGSSRPPDHHPAVPPATPENAMAGGDGDTSGSFRSSNSSLTDSQTQSRSIGATPPSLTSTAGRGLTIPASARDFILKCFAFDYKDRPSAEQLLSHPFVLSASQGASP